jgi:hypothetical protein
VTVKNARELVNRCYEQTNCLMSVEELKERFILFVFGPYQDEIVSRYGLEYFYKHLDSINLTNCRKDFDRAVEEWYTHEHGKNEQQADYHDLLFTLVKDTIVHYQSGDRNILVRDVTKMLTSPTGYYRRWRSGQLGERNLPAYFKYLLRLGIRSLADIESLVDMWLVEQPHAFCKKQQQLFAKPPRRGRPNNAELAQLQEMVGQIKQNLTFQERERLRKIYYYHRKNLTMKEMVEKFKEYLRAKQNENDTQAG